MDSLLIRDCNFNNTSYQAVLIARKMVFTGIESTNIINSLMNGIGLLTIEDAN